MLPFRLHAAWVTFQPANEAEALVKIALESALESSFDNLPSLPGRVAIAPDVSGSMSGSIHAPSKVRYIDIAAIFAGALLRKSRESIVLPFDTDVVTVDLWPRRPLIETVAKLAAIGSGGTAVSAPIAWLLARREPVDVLISITDCEEWAADRYGGAGFLPVWRRYRAEVAPRAEAFLITIAPYMHAVAPQDEPGVRFIYGWADHVPGYIAQTLNGYAAQVEAVRQVEL